MNLLEGTLALAVMMGVAATTLEIAAEVEQKHLDYQAAQKFNFEQARNIYRKSDH